MVTIQGEPLAGMRPSRRRSWGRAPVTTEMVNRVSIAFFLPSSFEAGAARATPAKDAATPAMAIRPTALASRPQSST